jgi:hypothetical protein
LERRPVMKKWTLLVSVLMLLTCFGAAQAQNKMGIGLVIFDRDLLSVLINQLGNLSLNDAGGGMDLSLLLPPSKIMIPFTMGNLKIEPEVGWMRYASKTENKAEKTEISGSSSSYKFGVGVFSVKTVKKTDIYFGGRIGLVMSSSTNKSPSILDPEDETEVSTSRTHLFFGPCMGGEYYISDNFSFGGEAQLIYTKLGQPKTKIDGKKDEDSDIETSGSMIDTRYMFVFRWYR